MNIYFRLVFVTIVSITTFDYNCDSRTMMNAKLS